MKIFKNVICIILTLIVVCVIVDVVGYESQINPRDMDITLLISSMIYSISIGFITGHVLGFIIAILGGKDYIFKNNKFQIIDKE
jgi:thiamine transporter ThiT